MARIRQDILRAAQGVRGLAANESRMLSASSSLDPSGDLLLESAGFCLRARCAADGRLVLLSLIVDGDFEWLRTLSDLPGPAAAVAIDGAMGRRNAVEAPSFSGTTAFFGRTYDFALLDRVAGVVLTPSRVEIASPTAAHGPSGIESTAVSAPDFPDAGGVTFSLASRHLRLVAATFIDQTDHHDELLFEREWLLRPAESSFRLEGCAFAIEDVLTGHGLVLLHQAPLPYARPNASGWDLAIDPRGRSVTLRADGYPWAIAAYSGGAHGRIAAAQGIQLALRPFVAGRDAVFLTNTWGDRSRDGRVSDMFLRAEIDAAAQMGADAVQIDDGWERGTTLNSVNASSGGVWEGFWDFDAGFWTAHPTRFPHGLAPIADAARAHGMGFGLWYGPDSADDFANWERDASTILRLHHETGATFFKIDGVKVRSSEGESNLRRLFDRVLHESGGAVSLDLDVTAEIRPGYFGAIEVGPVFVENRYTDWGRYYPHATLRNLWSLAQWMPPQRLRMEFLNRHRHPEKYENDPLAPIHYRADYLFATVMLSSPLGWFEAQFVPEDDRRAIGALAHVRKEHLAALASGTILPVGERPDGVSWTGFVVLPGANSATMDIYVLLFRESAHRESFLYEPIAALAVCRWSVTNLAGDGAVTVEADGRLRARISSPRSFVFCRLSADRA